MKKISMHLMTTYQMLSRAFNDVLKACSMKLDKDVLHTVKNDLDKAGFKEWSEEE